MPSKTEEVTSYLKTKKILVIVDTIAAPALYIVGQ